jgi:hypothetical protein
VVDHPLSLKESLRYTFAPPIGGTEATKLFSQGLFELVHCFIRLHCMFGGKQLSTIYPPLIPNFSTRNDFPEAGRLLVDSNASADERVSAKQAWKKHQTMLKSDQRKRGQTTVLNIAVKPLRESWYNERPKTRSKGY